MANSSKPPSQLRTFVISILQMRNLNRKMFCIVLKVTACNIRLTYVFQDAHLKLSSLSGGHQDGEVRGCWAQTATQIHRRYICIWQYSYQKQTGNCQKQFSFLKKNCTWIWVERQKWSCQDLCPLEETQEEREYNIDWGVKGFNHILGSDTLRIIPHLSLIRLATIKKTRVNKS